MYISTSRDIIDIIILDISVHHVYIIFLHESFDFVEIWKNLARMDEFAVLHVTRKASEALPPSWYQPSKGSSDVTPIRVSHVVTSDTTKVEVSGQRSREWVTWQKEDFMEMWNIAQDMDGRSMYWYTCPFLWGESIHRRTPPYGHRMQPPTMSPAASFMDSSK